MERFIVLPEVSLQVGLRKTTIYKMMKENAFPRPYRPYGRTVRWSQKEVQAWMEQIKSGQDASFCTAK